MPLLTGSEKIRGESDGFTVKTAFIGAGQGCRDVLGLVDRGRLEVFDLEVVAVCDTDPQAPGYRYAAEKGWPTYDRLDDALALDGLELVIELTGDEDVLDDIYFLLPPGVRLMDHVVAQVFWDLDNVTMNLRDQLRATRELEAAVEDDRARLQEILDTLPDVVMVLDPEMRIVRVNKRFEEVASTPREDVHGRYCHEGICYNPHLADCLDDGCPYMKVVHTGHTVEMIHTKRGSDNSERHYQITASPVFDAEGNISRVVETTREITEQVMLKRETEESAQRFRQIIGAVHGAITIKDLDGRYLLVNPRALKLFGLEPTDIIGRTAGEAFPCEVAQVIVRHDGWALDAREHHVSEEILPLRGKDRVLISERFPLADYKGDVVGLCCVARDDTRQREMRQEMLQQERLAAVGKLAAGVAHELNNPLTGILTFAEELLLDASEDDPSREDYEIIVQETMRCRRIVRDLLDFSRQQASHREPMDINPVVVKTIAMVERQPSFHDLKIWMELNDDLPKVGIDPALIQQAILNLVINARDAMNARGTLTITSRRAGDDQGVVVSVADTGVGIAEDVLGRIFEPFFSTKGDQGNGLGLPAVKSVMDQHGGRIEVDSKLGEGTTFRLVFPAA